MLNKISPGLKKYDEVIAQLNVDLDIELELIIKCQKLKNDVGIICSMLCVGTHKDYQGRGISKVLTRLLV